MSSFKRKLARKSKGKFVKKMKSVIKTIKSGVHCSQCERPPSDGEKIDNWRIIRTENSMALTCPECYQSEDSEDGDE